MHTRKQLQISEGEILHYSGIHSGHFKSHHSKVTERIHVIALHAAKLVSGCVDRNKQLKCPRIGKYNQTTNTSTHGHLTSITKM